MTIGTVNDGIYVNYVYSDGHNWIFKTMEYSFFSDLNFTGWCDG